MGPYNSPLPLAKEFWSSMAWVICGYIVFSVLLFQFASAIWPVIFDTSSDARNENYFWAVSWVAVVSAALLLFAVTEWSNWIGAGYFAGRLRGERGWFLIAIFVSPVIWIGISILMNTIMGGGSDWVYANEESAAYAANAQITLASVFYVVLLAPLWEELVYRGVGMGAMLARGWHPFLAVGVISALFAGIHLQYSPAAVFIVFVGGIWFGILRLVSGSVGVAIAAHVSINATLTLLQA